MKKKHSLRRVVLTSAVTVSGIVLMLALKPGTDPSVHQAGAPSAPVTAVPSASMAVSTSTPASASPSVSASASGRAGHRRATSSPAASISSSFPTAPRRTSTAPSTPKTTTAAPTTRTVTGPTVQTNYGPVQVRITLTGTRITGATAVQYPDETARSRDINSTAVPKLNQETLAAQSASIDSVSGATYTSTGYKQSLQSALDQAGV
ncbi:FMN-binding protein [Actinacidiphila sp. bgisy160]|uniref:FMN-binding protein n=1 Tax=Actinacidiphila sp. bgisy160 TaxID=3413796 RepID=UPI003D753EB7